MMFCSTWRSCDFIVVTEASEKAQARLKGLDETMPNITKPKDVNTFKNNQVKFAGGSTIPPDQMKCNILKAKVENDLKKGELMALVYSWFLLYCKL